MNHKTLEYYLDLENNNNKILNRSSRKRPGKWVNQKSGKVTLLVW